MIDVSLRVEQSHKVTHSKAKKQKFPCMLRDPDFNPGGKRHFYRKKYKVQAFLEAVTATVAVEKSLSTVLHGSINVLIGAGTAVACVATSSLSILTAEGQKTYKKSCVSSSPTSLDARNGNRER